MPDGTYVTKVYEKAGGDELVVASGGQITIETGGDVDVDGASLVDNLALLTALPTEDQTDGVTIWNDSGVLKVSTSS